MLFISYISSHSLEQTEVSVEIHHNINSSGDIIKLCNEEGDVSQKYASIPNRFLDSHNRLPLKKMCGESTDPDYIEVLGDNDERKLETEVPRLNHRRNTLLSLENECVIETTKKRKKFLHSKTEQIVVITIILIVVVGIAVWSSLTRK
ncbi:hypothetical protein CDIK_1551 [Cucumispora dikerogammari]|nr:hypothetical protein CDIK_1551 [Cucumispora dikerogammari]